MLGEMQLEIAAMARGIGVGQPLSSEWHQHEPYTVRTRTVYCTNKYQLSFLLLWQQGTDCLNLPSGLLMTATGKVWQLLNKLWYGLLVIGMEMSRDLLLTHSGHLLTLW